MFPFDLLFMVDGRAFASLCANQKTEVTWVKLRLLLPHLRFLYNERDVLGLQFLKTNGNPVQTMPANHAFQLGGYSSVPKLVPIVTYVEVNYIECRSPGRK